MVYNTQNYWVCVLCPSPGILIKKKKTTFRKLDLFPSSSEEERANLNHWTTMSKVKDTLRLTVSQSVSLGVEPHL
jgi:hypothetical protein